VRTGLGGRTSCTSPPPAFVLLLFGFSVVRREKARYDVGEWDLFILGGPYATLRALTRKYFSTSFAESSRHDGALNESSYNTILSLLFTILSLLFTVDTTSVHKKQVRSKALASRSSLTELLWAAMRDPFPFPTLTKSNLAASSAMSFTRTRSSWEEAPLGRV
jgi:hypothetical protein